MKIGDQPAFPSEQHETNDGTWNQTYDPGMTYRQWLVGQIAGWAYAEMMKIDLRKNPDISIESSTALMATEVADAIIKRMEVNE